MNQAFLVKSAIVVFKHCAIQVKLALPINYFTISPLSHSLTGTMDVKDFVAEAQVMKKIQHPNLLQLYAVCTHEEPIYIVTELMKYGSLLEHMRHGSGQNLTMPQMIDMVAQIACGKFGCVF